MSDEIVEQTEELSQEEQEARRYVRRLKILYKQAALYGVLTLMLFFINLITSTSYWWFVWPALGFGVALAIQALPLFVFNNLFDSDWEAREIEKRMNAQKK